jgi:hypothetical protein
MMTFVVRFVRGPSESFRGRVRHVSTGEETAFASAGELLAFFEEMEILGGFRKAGADPAAQRDTSEHPRSAQLAGDSGGNSAPTDLLPERRREES